MYEMRDITQMLGIKRAALRQWVDLGFVSPSVKADGHGTRNVWSREDVLGLAVFKELIDHGFSRGEAAKLVKSQRLINATKDGITIPDKNSPGFEFTVEILGCRVQAVQMMTDEGFFYNYLISQDGDSSIFVSLDAISRHYKLPSVFRAVRIVDVTLAINDLLSKV